MSSIVEILDAVADTLRTAIQPDEFPVQVEPRRLFNPSPPTIDMYPADPFRSSDDAGFVDIDGAYLFTVRARVNTTDQDAWQDFLLAILDDEDPLSVAAALNANSTLNDTATATDVTAPTGYRLYREPGGDGAYLGCEWTLVVIPVRE